MSRQAPTVSRSRALCAAAALLVAFGPVAAVSSAQAFNAPLWDRLVGELGAEDLTERDAATDAILNLEGITLPRIEAALERDELSGEQRARLERIGEKLFSRTARAAMGIGFARVQAGAVQITEPHEGFDAFNKLRAGDTIVRTDGRPVEGQDGLRIAILSRDPGEELELSIERDGEPMTITVTLGSLANLRGAATSPSLLREAWTERRTRRLGKDGGEPARRIIDATPPIDWVGLIHDAGDAGDAGEQVPVIGDGRRMFAGGSDASADPDPDGRRRTPGVPIVPPARPGEDAAERLAAVEEALRQQNASINSVTEMLERTRTSLAANADDAEKLAQLRRIEARYIEYREELRLARDRTERMMLELKERMADAEAADGENADPVPVPLPPGEQ